MGLFNAYEKMVNALSKWWNPPSATPALPDPTPKTPIRRAAGIVVDSPTHPTSPIAMESTFDENNVKNLFNGLTNT